MVEVTIERLGHLGDGVAEGPVFVPGALPGEVVRGELHGDCLSDMRIVTPSPQRVTPPCRHFKSCGGCQMQHMAPDALADWKADVVRSALATRGVEVERELPMAISPPRTRRRATFAARRTKKGAMAGFYGRQSDVITEIPDCQLLHPDLMPGLELARALAEAGGSRKGTLRVSVTLAEPGLDVEVREGKPLDGPLRLTLAQLAGQFGLVRLTWGDETVLTTLPPTQRFGAQSVVPPPGAFLQATKQGEEALLADVQEIVAGARHVADLFAGCGTFALPVAERARVHAVEGDPAMTEALEAGWRHGSRLKPVTTETRDLFREPLMAEELTRFDAVILDPPRAGAEAQVAQLAAGVPRIAHVSCNPVTFAREAESLCQAGYRLTRLRVVDQFSWSTHVELVAGFEKADG
jgi:23S rRNA (uracil1939-C5)-methyltransferase